MNTLIPWKRGEIQSTTSAAPFTQMRSDWDRLFDRFLDDVWGPAGTSSSRGLVLDVSETDDALIVRAEIPGIDPKDVDVNLAGDVLTISGQKAEESGEERSRYHHTERRFGSFQRSLRLPVPVEAGGVEAECRNGLLTVTLRKAEALRPKKIAIRTS